MFARCGARPAWVVVHRWTAHFCTAQHAAVPVLGARPLFAWHETYVLAFTVAQRTTRRHTSIIIDEFTASQYTIHILLCRLYFCLPWQDGAFKRLGWTEPPNSATHFLKIFFWFSFSVRFAPSAKLHTVVRWCWVDIQNFRSSLYVTPRLDLTIPPGAELLCSYKQL